MRVPIEVSDLRVLLAAASVMRAAMEESGADPTVLDEAVANIAQVITEPVEGYPFWPGPFSDN